MSRAFPQAEMQPIYGVCHYLFGVLHAVFFRGDVIGVENLQTRAFALGRWKMREWLFGLHASPPDPSPIAVHVRVVQARGLLPAVRHAWDCITYLSLRRRWHRRREG